MLEYTLEARYNVAMHWIAYFQRDPRLANIPEWLRVCDMNRLKDVKLLREGKLEEGFILELCSAVADCVDIHVAMMSQEFWNEKT